MKCERCGAQNKDTLTVCPMCGAKLNPPVYGGDKLNIWEREKSDPAPLGKQNPEEPKTDASGIRPDPVFVSDPSELHDLADQQVINMVIPPEEAIEPPKKRIHIHWGRFLLSLGIALMLLCLGGLGVYSGVRWILRTIEARRSAVMEAEQAKLPLVERVLLDGSYWHRITFYGEDGSRILIDNPRETLSIHNGIAEYMLEDNALIPESPETDQVEVNISATLIGTDGTEEAIPTVSYHVDVPQAYLKMIDPVEQTLTSNETRLLITMKVDVGSRVLLGESNITDLVNSDGIVTSSVPIDDVGTNTITIVVESSKHRRTTYELQVTRAPMDVEITLDSDVSASTEDGAVLISGQTEAGASITTDAEVEGEIRMQSDGRFSFTANLPQYGWNLIKITASKDGRAATLGYQVRHVPNLESYTRSAWAMDYSYLSIAPDALMGQVFLCRGTVTEFLEDDLTTLMRFNCGTEEHPEYIILEYSGDADLTIGTPYRIYADVVGVHEDLPKLAARFIYTN